MKPPSKAKIPVAIALVAFMFLGGHYTIQRFRSQAPQGSLTCPLQSLPFNEDSGKFLPTKDPGIISEDSPAVAPTFNGVRAKQLLAELNSRFGLRLKQAGDFEKRKYVAPLRRQFDLFESECPSAAGLTGDAVTQGDALLQIAVAVQLPGDPDGNAEGLAGFRGILDFVEKARGPRFAQWILDKAQVALLEPERPFFAKTTLENLLVTFRYREGKSFSIRPCLIADFEEPAYFQWLMNQHAAETQSRSQDRLK
jgi:hypothetical protein